MSTLRQYVMLAHALGVRIELDELGFKLEARRGARVVTRLVLYSTLEAAQWPIYLMQEEIRRVQQAVEVLQE